jgi:hypothetical protein
MPRETSASSMVTGTVSNRRSRVRRPDQPRLRFPIRRQRSAWREACTDCLSAPGAPAHGVYGWDELKRRASRSHWGRRGATVLPLAVQAQRRAERGRGSEGEQCACYRQRCPPRSRTEPRKLERWPFAANAFRRLRHFIVGQRLAAPTATSFCLSTDSMRIGLQIGWGLSGSGPPLAWAVARERGEHGPHERWTVLGGRGRIDQRLPKRAHRLD